MLRNHAQVLDILEAAKLAGNFVKDLEKKEFINNPLCQSAVFWQLEVMGEAVKRLSLEFRVDHPNIPWKKIAGMRDILIHCYDGIDLDEVWRTAKEDIPPLIKNLEILVPPE